MWLVSVTVIKLEECYSVRAKLRDWLNEAKTETLRLKATQAALAAEGQVSTIIEAAEEQAAQIAEKGKEQIKIWGRALQKQRDRRDEESRRNKRAFAKRRDEMIEGLEKERILADIQYEAREEDFEKKKKGYLEQIEGLEKRVQKLLQRLVKPHQPGLPPQTAV